MATVSSVLPLSTTSTWSANAALCRQASMRCASLWVSTATVNVGGASVTS